MDDDGELLAAVAGGLVGRAADAAQAGAERLEHAVAGEVAVAVVDRLEVVDVEQDQPGRLGVALVPRDGGAEQLLQAAVVREPGQLVGDGLAAQRGVALGVAGGDRRLLAQVVEQRALLVAERGGAAGDADDAGGRARAADRPGERPGAVDHRLGRLVRARGAPLGGLQRGGAGGVVVRGGAQPVRGAGAAAVGVERVDRRAHGDRQQRLGVERRRERLADPLHGDAQPPALALQRGEAGVRAGDADVAVAREREQQQRDAEQQQRRGGSAGIA